MQGPVLEATMQNFYQEAKSVIAEHHQRINETKVQGATINVFRNKCPKSGKVKLLDLEKKEALDVIQGFQKAYRNICFSKDLSIKEHSKKTPQVTFKKPHIFNIDEACNTAIDLIVKGKVELSKILTDIDSVSKKMEKENQAASKNISFFDSSPVPRLIFDSSKQQSMSIPPEKDHVCDWRGVMSTRPSLVSEYDRLSFSGPSSIFKDFYTKQFVRVTPHAKPVHKHKPRMQSILSKIDKYDNKVKRIGPHIEIFQLFRKNKKLKMDNKIIRKVTIMQAAVRGWLERKRMQRIMAKALDHASDLREVINMYTFQIYRIQYRLGLPRTRQVLKLAELEEWMDRKKFYETMFAKRQDWQGLDKSELLKYFNDCGHFPAPQQIEDIWNLVQIGSSDRYNEIIKKNVAVEMLFTLYPPLGAQVKDNKSIKSTWLRPIVEGEEGYKYIVANHPVLKRADIRIVGKLVAKSIRERKIRQHRLL